MRCPARPILGAMAKPAGASKPAKPTREEKKSARAAKKQGRRDTWRSMRQAFTLTRQQDPKFLPYVILFSVLTAAALYLIVLWITDSPYFGIPFAVFGFLIVAMFVFTRRAQKAMFSQAEGQPGAAGYLLQQQLKGDWRVARRGAPAGRASRHRAGR
jgi:Flp pilus assembly protein TadB